MLAYKRLEAGSFKWPRTGEEARALTAQQYSWLMEGLEIEQPGANRTVSGWKEKKMQKGEGKLAFPLLFWYN